MIKSFFGYHNDVWLRVIGCIYIKRKNFIISFFVDYFRYRKTLKLSENEAFKWTIERFNRLAYNEKVFIRICLLLKLQFYNIISYC